MLLIRWFKKFFGTKEHETIVIDLESKSKFNRSNIMQDENKETNKKQSKNFVYVDINSTKEVLLNQVLMEIISDSTFKTASTRDKEKLKRKLDALFSSQFDNLVTRLQKKLV
jgi:hypothetical protein